MTLLGPYAGLSWRFTVSCDSPEVAGQIELVFASLATAAPGTYARYVLSSPSTTPGTLTVEDELLLETYDEYALYARLLWHLNQASVAATTELVLLHASAAELGGRAVIMCAPPESGKTTLVAGLVKAGMRYLTDEVVAISAETHRISPFPKALAVDEGSWTVLSDLRPDLPEGARHLLRKQWHVPPTAIRDDSVSMGATPAVILLPRYDREGPTELEAITPGTALLGLLQDTFELTRQPERDVNALALIAQSCRCYRLVVQDLDAAVSLVREVLQDAGRGLEGQDASSVGILR